MGSIKLVALVCLFVACKYEGNRGIGADDILKYGNYRYELD